MNQRGLYTLSPAQPAALAGLAARIALGAAALALASRLSLPFWPVPATAQTLAVLLLGVMLGPRQGAASVAAFLAAGLMGLPAFAAGGGPLYLLGPTGGYLLGFVPAAYLAGSFAQRGWGGRLWTALAAMTLTDAVIFACGLAWLLRFLPPQPALLKGLLLFLPGECVKIALAAAVLRKSGTGVSPVAT
jgi:biotin transport system substrate-specific component